MKSQNFHVFPELEILSFSRFPEAVWTLDNNKQKTLVILICMNESA